MRHVIITKYIKCEELVRVPQSMRAEMIVVDNGSEDSTASVIRAARHPQMEIQMVIETCPCKSRALIAGVGEAKSDVLLFADDDVEPVVDWTEKMARPLLERGCAAVAGRILLGEKPRRDWQTPLQGLWLAVEPEPKGESPILIGASMGFSVRADDLAESVVTYRLS